MQISVFIAIGYGFLSFFSPCILPLIPVYLGSLAGPEVFEKNSTKNRLPVFLHALSFVFGFTLVFTMFGAGSGVLGSIILGKLNTVRQLAGILLIVFGLVMLAASRIPSLNLERRFNLRLPPAVSYLRSFLIGAVFPVAWIPCTSWVLGSILLLAGTSQTAFQGAYLLAFYSLGLGLPFLILGAAFDIVMPWMKNIGRYSNWIYLASGLLLIVFGFLILTDKLGLFPGQL
jgi:cytochrome c-type biogenesis protein